MPAFKMSDNPQWAAGIQSARYYVENYELKEDMSDHDKGDEDDGKFGLYANQLSMPEKVVIQIKGKDGNKDRPAGCGGGTIECYIERADASIAEELHFHVPGGSGLAREPLEKLSGGDGGHGGQVNISFCTDYLETVKHIDVVTDLLSDSDAHLESALIELIKFSKEETEAGLLNVIILEELKTVEAATQCERGVLKRALRKLRERAFEDPAKEIQVNLAQRADVKGGPYGLGTTNGKRGKDGSISVFHIALSNRLFQDAFLIPELKSQAAAAVSSIEPCAVKSGIQLAFRLQNQYFKQYKKGKMDWGEYKLDEVDVKFDENPLRLNIVDEEKSLNPIVSWDWHLKAPNIKWSEDPHLGIPSGSAGVVDINADIPNPDNKETWSLVQADDVLKPIINFTEAHQPKMTFTSHKEKFWMEKFPEDFKKQLTIKLPLVIQQVRGLDFFATQNVFAPGQQFITVSDIMVPYDVVLMGKMED